MLSQRKSTILFIWALFSAAMLDAQNSLNPTFYRQNWELINPAAINRWLFWDDGDHQHHTISFSGRRQWFGAGFDESPQFVVGSYEFSPENTSLKAGGTFYYDKTGPISTMALNLIGSTQVFLTEPSGIRLNAGIGLSFAQYRVDVSGFSNKDTDPVVQAWAGGHYFMDVMGGLFLHVPKIFYLGLSIPQAFVSEFEEEQLKRKLSPHIYFTAGRYLYPTGHESGGFFEFSTICRYIPRLSYVDTPFKKASFEINTRYWFWSKNKEREWLWLGAGWGNNRLMNAELGFEFREDERGRRNKAWRDRIGIVLGWPVGKLASPFGYQLELAYSHAWY